MPLQRSCTFTKGKEQSKVLDHGQCFSLKERTLAAVWEVDWKGKHGGRKMSLEAIANILARAAKGQDGGQI